jgi:hypothetical protein
MTAAAVSTRSLKTSDECYLSAQHALLESLGDQPVLYPNREEAKEQARAGRDAAELAEEIENGFRRPTGS